MPAIEMQGNNWFASVIISEQNDININHVTVKTIADTKENALKASQFVQDIFTFGRTSYVRCNPESNSDTDFDTKITHHRGYGRFSFKLEAGEQQSIVAAPIVLGLGNLQCKEVA